MADIVAEGLGRRFALVDHRRGLVGALKDLVAPQGRTAEVVRDLTFRIGSGEAVALIGPNGAGKSTTIKMLTGILQPSTGTIRVGGLDPWRDRSAHVRRVGAVFGQRTQLWWDLAVIEALDLLAAMFDVSAADAQARIRRFDALLGIGPLLRTPVRQLSLGERMRCELAAALLHAPTVLFLDEPTIGLDVAVKLRLRAFLAALRDEGDTTIVLTTHDLADVAALCPRVLLLAEGRLIHDGPMAALTETLGGRRSLHVQLRAPISDPDLAALCVGLPAAERQDPETFRMRFGPETQAPELIRRVLERCDPADLRLEDPPIEELVARFYEAR